MFNRRRFVQAGTTAMVGVSMWGCGRETQPTAGAGDTSATFSDGGTVFRNGIVLPVDAAFSEHTALAIRGNQIVAVGNEDAVMGAVGANPRIVDLEGRVVLPGFIEPHMHFLLLAGLGHLEDVGPFQKPTFDDAVDAIREIPEMAASAGPEQWVMGRQFDPILLEPPRELTTAELDEAVPDRPVFVLNASGHIAYVNSRTLELAGITRDTPDPQGAEYGRYEDGSPNGVLYGAPAHLPVLLMNQQIAERMRTGFVDAGREVGNMAAAVG